MRPRSEAKRSWHSAVTASSSPSYTTLSSSIHSASSSGLSSCAASTRQVARARPSAAYQRFRHAAGELGLEPSSTLMQLERDIVRGSLARFTPNTPHRAAIDLRVAGAAGPATFGRQAELASVRSLFDSERVVTVVGPGGVGKTHLALQLVETLHSDVAVVPLSPVTDLDGAVAVLARSLDLRSTSGDLFDDCLQLLQHDERVLVIDNCEHVLDAARDLVGGLVAGCARLRVLTTSRERLGLPVEFVFRLAPLPVPPAEALETADVSSASSVSSVSSVSLFVDRARRVRPDFAPGAGQLATIVDIVRRASTACRWASSWRRDGLPSWGSRIWRSVSTERSICSRVAGRTAQRVTAHCAPPWSGPTSSSMKTNVGCSAPCRCSPTGST